MSHDNISHYVCSAWWTERKMKVERKSELQGGMMCWTFRKCSDWSRRSSGTFCTTKLNKRWFTRSYAWAAPPSPSAIVNLRRCWPITQLHFMTKSSQLYIIVWRLLPFEIKSRHGSNETVRLTEESIISSCSSSHRGERHVCQIFAYFPSRWK